MTSHPIYLATAHIWDDEFRQRVARHQERRGSNWTNIEEEKYLSRHNIYNKVCVIDCITLWCTNFFYDKERQQLIVKNFQKSMSTIIRISDIKRIRLVPNTIREAQKRNSNLS